MSYHAVIVSGLPRSGTSLLMQIAVASGLAPLADNHREPDRHNPRGYFEYRDVRNLRAQAGDPPWYDLAATRAIKLVAPLPTLIAARGRWSVLFADRPAAAILRSQERMLKPLTPPDGVDLSPDVANNDNAGRARQRLMLKEARDYTLNWLYRRAATRVLLVDTEELCRAPTEPVARIAEFLAPVLGVAPDEAIKRRMQAVVEPALFGSADRPSGVPARP